MKKLIFCVFLLFFCYLRCCFVILDSCNSVWMSASLCGCKVIKYYFVSMDWDDIKMSCYSWLVKSKESTLLKDYLNWFHWNSFSSSIGWRISWLRDYLIWKQDHAVKVVIIRATIITFFIFIFFLCFFDYLNIRCWSIFIWYYVSRTDPVSFMFIKWNGLNAKFVIRLITNWTR